jgi:23S rRNA pseudouridine1911/1915/1917 synthase
MAIDTVSVELTAQALPKHYGSRLDQVVAELFSDYSRSRLKAWILAGNVTVDGSACIVPRHKLKGDEVIAISAELATEVTHAPEKMDLNIVFEDEHILVIDKQRDVVVHPGAGNASGTLLNALLAHDPKIDKVPRAGIVHRLDKDTTGLMVVAKTLTAQTHLVEQLQTRTMGREYEALCQGTFVAGGVVDAPMGRHSTKRTLMAVRELGKPAVTHYRVIEKFRAFTHVRLKLDTGRTHQIRVHMAYIKHPLLGDPTYGGRPRLPKGASDEFIHILRQFDRQALHAIQLTLTHPVTNEEMVFHADYPSDFYQLLQAVRDDTKTHGLHDHD